MSATRHPADSNADSHSNQAVTGRNDRPPAELDLVRGALAGEFEIVEEIGRGGMAVVYRARERELERDVAIKVLPPQLAFDESFVERFQREARIAAQLEHPHIVPVYRVGRNGQVVYMAMKLLRGESLADRLRTRGVLAPPEARRVIAETASALAYAATRGVVHRDIKPHNIMLDEDDRCVVTDFGIARSGADSRLTATGMSVGTPRYMSPEQARARPVDGRSDLYSLGVVGYECFVGATPFDGEDPLAILMQHLKAPVPRPVLRTGEERALFAVIERLLAKEPDDRFQSGEEVVEALRAPTEREAASVTPTAATAPTEVLAATRALATVDAQDPTAPLDPSGPRAPDALDRGLDRMIAVGLDLFRRQAPRLGAVRRLLADHRGRAAAVGVAMAGAAQRVRQHVAPRDPRFWGGIAAVMVLGVATYQGAHFATKHRSRCPGGAGGQAGVALQGDAAGPRRRPFSVMLDPVEPQSVGAKLDVYFDVCGLENSTPYTASLTVTKTEAGLRRLLGSAVSPVRVSYDETARGPATRRHRTIDLSDMPAGSYWLEVVVTDDHGRKRTKGTGVRLVQR